MSATQYVPRHIRAKRPTVEEWQEYDTKPIWVMQPPKGEPPMWPAVAAALGLLLLVAACLAAGQ